MGFVLDSVTASLAGAFRLGGDVAVGVACSGGADSLVLAHCAALLQRQGKLGSVTLLHVDHGLRADSAADAQSVQTLGAELGVEVCVRHARVDTETASLENAARVARYRELDDAMNARAIHWILLAHTASDQAETVVMRMVRGSGIRGLAAIPARRGRYLRPMLAVTREQVMDFVARIGATPRSDAMNHDNRFFRVRVRHSILPALRRENPQVDRALCRLAEASRECEEALECAAREVLDGARDGKRLQVDRLRTKPALLVKRALQLWRQEWGEGEDGVDPLAARHLHALLALVNRPEAGTLGIDVPGGRIERVYNHMQWAGDRGGEDSVQIFVAGPTPPYEVRSWRPGDRMCPQRLHGRSRKLSDLFGDAKIPVTTRQHSKVVICKATGSIEWAQGIGYAHNSQVEVTLTPSKSVASNGK